MVKAMKRQMRYVARSHFVRGLSSMLDIAGSSARPTYTNRDDVMEALRGDMRKIGQDMYRVIEREKVNEKTA